MMPKSIFYYCFNKEIADIFVASLKGGVAFAVFLSILAFADFVKHLLNKFLLLYII